MCACMHAHVHVCVCVGAVRACVCMRACCCACTHGRVHACMCVSLGRWLDAWVEWMDAPSPSPVLWGLRGSRYVPQMSAHRCTHANGGTHARHALRVIQSACSTHSTNAQALLCGPWVHLPAARPLQLHRAASQPPAFRGLLAAGSQPPQAAAATGRPALNHCPSLPCQLEPNRRPPPPPQRPRHPPSPAAQHRLCCLLAACPPQTARAWQGPEPQGTPPAAAAAFAAAFAGSASAAAPAVASAAAPAVAAAAAAALAFAPAAAAATRLSCPKRASSELAPPYINIDTQVCTHMRTKKGQDHAHLKITHAHALAHLPALFPSLPPSLLHRCRTRGVCTCTRVRTHTLCLVCTRSMDKAIHPWHDHRHMR